MYALCTDLNVDKYICKKNIEPGCFCKMLVFVYHITRQGCVVGIASKPMAGRSGVRYTVGATNFLFSQNYRQAVVSKQPPI
jgi:hypothetical protein